ncbi:putative nucleolar complex protein 14 [Emericellopsis cladophorae]|uniref:Nucleolar complex protein 14 n=1 Tax=Emericellopsis cladophorae TaxID=2686198 RepID=A0A9Q0BBB0_9HYPO|nr:putative nucleolar complex protein 14 [Emericellopsis cladophorae]KAI6779627.1 putative nucleolar complex protein 14 [Emericellopsis cladophorae]
MAGGGSQLKRLKASLRDQGITGPQQSKKQKRRAAQDEQARNDKRLQRGAVLGGIREQFNPFDLKHAKAPKFEVTSNRPDPKAGSIRGRPGEAKAAAEEKRFGENDPTMTPEEKMLERFAREKIRSHKKNAFDLEEDMDDMGMGGLTHGGKALVFNEEEAVDDFDEDLDDAASDISDREQQRRKRVRAMAAEDQEEAEPQRKRTKKEIMEEVIAKSKMHKYERQQAKDEDDDLRAQIDKDMAEIRAALYASGSKRPEPVQTEIPTMGGLDREAFNKTFDLEVKKLAQDRRAQPADRTKTDEEKAEDEAKFLKKLEEKRQKRMRGESVSDSDASEDDKAKNHNSDEDMDHDDDFGLGGGLASKAPEDEADEESEEDESDEEESDEDNDRDAPTKKKPTAAELGFDDEDDFVIDDDLVASGSDINPFDSGDELDLEETEAADGAESESDDEDEFTKGLLNEEEARNPMFKAESSENTTALEKGDDKGLPFTFPCPQTKEEFESIARAHPLVHLPTIVQRIRALYHPKLDSKNKERLGTFATVLVEFISQPFGVAFDPAVWPSFAVLESLVRHVHSLSKMFPVEIGNHFRQMMIQIKEERPLALEVGDIVMLTAVGTVFPPSDHFNSVVTPGILTATRYLGIKVPRTLGEHATGVYLSILMLQFQQPVKRFVPEVINFLLNTICALSPVAPKASLGRFPLHASDQALRISGAQKVTPRKLRCSDCAIEVEAELATETKVSLMDTALQVCDAAADTWTGKDAFIETFDQVQNVVKRVLIQKNSAHLPAQLISRLEKLQTKLERMMRLAKLARRPLELHHHRPLAIKTYIPKFEDSFDPNKHYDPDRERAEMAKLKAEHKKERKGAMRELRKDANFMAREKLKVKKAKDEAHEKKMKRLISEIQSEEGREANEYERERSARKRAKNR